MPTRLATRPELIEINKRLPQIGVSRSQKSLVHRMGMLRHIRILPTILETFNPLVLMTGVHSEVVAPFILMNLDVSLLHQDMGSTTPDLLL